MVVIFNRRWGKKTHLLSKIGRHDVILEFALECKDCDTSTILHSCIKHTRLILVNRQRGFAQTHDWYQPITQRYRLERKEKRPLTVCGSQMCTQKRSRIQYSFLKQLGTLGIFSAMPVGLSQNKLWYVHGNEGTSSATV